MTRLGLLVIALVALGCVLASSTAAAQEAGNISGVVKDALRDQPLAGVQVLIDGGRRGDVTDSQGRYRVRELRSGWHSIEIRFIGKYIDGKNFDAVPIFNTNALKVWHKCFAIGAPSRPKKQDDSLLFGLVR